MFNSQNYLYTEMIPNKMTSIDSPDVQEESPTAL